MTGGQTAPTTPLGAETSSAPYGNYEQPFNLVGLAAAAGASFVARWTVSKVRKLSKTISNASKHSGFRFIEIVSPCPTVFGSPNKKGMGLDMLHEFDARTRVDNNAAPNEIPLGMDGEIVCGEFINKERATYWQNVQKGIKRRVQLEVDRDSKQYDRS